MSVKVGEVLDPEVNPFYQIIGANGETNKIRLREGYSKSHVFTKGNTYKVSVKSPDVGEVWWSAVTLSNFTYNSSNLVPRVSLLPAKEERPWERGCNSSRNFVATQVARKIATCNTPQK